MVDGQPASFSNFSTLRRELSPRARSTADLREQICLRSQIAMTSHHQETLLSLSYTFCFGRNSHEGYIRKINTKSIKGCCAIIRALPTKEKLYGLTVSALTLIQWEAAWEHYSLLFSHDSALLVQVGHDKSHQCGRRLHMAHQC